MKNRVSKVAMVIALLATTAWAQVLMGVKGKVSDAQGNPMPGVTVELKSPESGHRYNLKTDKKGEYSSIGVASGVYDFTFSKDGKVIFTASKFRINPMEPTGFATLDVNLAKEAQAAVKQMTPEQQKAIEAASKEHLTVKALNEKLAAATAAQTAGNWDQAVAIMTEASQLDPTRDLIWFRLGEALSGSAGAAPKESRKEKYELAVPAYQKAIDIATASADPKAKSLLGSYYNNQGQAYGRSGKSAEAIEAYNKAAQVDPNNAGQYYYNMGAVLTNTGKTDEANTAFDKAIAADPNRADAYYQKGVNLLQKATIKDGKVVAPEGTAEALNKYLQVAPEGQFAGEAKSLLTQIGATIETTYGTRSAKKKK